MSTKLKADILKEKLDLIFANRQEQTELFAKLITSEKLENSLLVVRGLGGIGKTMLLGAYQRICVEKEVPVAIIDVGVQRNVAEALRSIRDQLVKNGYGFLSTHFDAAVERYLNLDSELRKLGSISIRALEIISKATVLSPVTLSSKISEKLDIEGEDYGLVINRIYQNFEKRDADYFVNPEEYLSKELLKDINDYTQNHHLCVMFDRYEVVPVYLDRWIRRDFFANLAELVLVVISGRSLLPPEWGKWRPLMKNVELSPFPKSEIQELLQLFGITSSYLIEQIAQFSGGVPLAVSLAAHLVKDRNTEDFSMVTEKYNVIEQLVEVLVRDASPELEKILEVCAVLRWFNEDSVKTIMGEQYSQKIFKLIRGYDFVRRGRYGFEMHDRVRDFINQDLAQREPARYRKLNKLASEYYANSFIEDTTQDRQLLILEKLYHKLRADEKEGMEEMRQVFNDAALLIQPSFCQSLIEVAESTSLQDEINGLWVEYFKGSLARQSSDFEKAEEIFGRLAKDALIERSKDLKAEIYYNWGVALWYVCRFPESLEISQQAVELNHALNKSRFENRSLGIIGLIQDRFGDSWNGVETVTTMVSQARKTNDRASEGYGLNSTGYFSWHTGKWDKAEDAFLQSRDVWIDLGSKFGECYPVGHLGLLYTVIDDYKRGFDYLNTCLTLSKECGNREMESKSYQNFSEFERRNQRFDTAVKYAEDACNLSRKLNHPYYLSDSLRLLGEALSAQGNLQESYKKHFESLALASSLNAPYLVVRNQVALWKLSSSDKVEGINFKLTDITDLALKKRFFHLLAELYLVEAKRALVNSQSEICLDFYKSALANSVRYNWHWLMRVLRSIVNDFTDQVSEGNKNQITSYLELLIHFWQNGEVEGVSLQEMETRASRVRSIKHGVDEKIIDRLEIEKSKLARLA